MSSFKKVLNTVTNQEELHFNSKLTKIGDTLLSNSNQKNYVIGECEFTTPKGDVVTRSCQIFEGNLIDKKTGETRMEVGKDYNTIMTKNGDNVYLRMTNITNTDRASLSDFDGIDEVIQQETPAQSLAERIG